MKGQEKYVMVQKHSSEVLSELKSMRLVCPHSDFLIWYSLWLHNIIKEKKSYFDLVGLQALSFL